MNFRLIERGDTPGQNREIPVTREEFLIGRGADCDLRLEAVSVSRHHCKLRLAGGGATVTDLDSRNGTSVNGQRVSGQAPLHSGDVLGVGTVFFLVELGDGGQAGSDTAVGVAPTDRTVKLPPETQKAGTPPATPKGTAD